MVRTIGLAAFMIVLLSVGVAGLFFSERVQHFYIRSVDQGHSEITKRRIRSRTARLSIIAAGIGAILMFFGLLWASVASR